MAKDWEERFQRQPEPSSLGPSLVARLGKTVVELTGDFTPDIDALERADVVVTTPEKWDGISRHWQHRACPVSSLQSTTSAPRHERYVRKVGLVIIDEIHLLGQEWTALA